MNTFKLSIAFGLVLLPTLSFAEPTVEESTLVEQVEMVDEGKGKSTEELAKAAQNPIASMISLPIQNNTNLNIGPNDSTQNILNVQPVWPFKLNDDWNVITRTIIPVVYNPDVLTGEGRVGGVGDTLFTAFISPSGAFDVTWGVRTGCFTAHCYRGCIGTGHLGSRNIRGCSDDAGQLGDRFTRQ